MTAFPSRLGLTALALAAAAMLASAGSAPIHHEGWAIESDAQVARDEGGPHDGAGRTTAYSFFESVSDLSFVFRKRALHRGATIGHHRQVKDEIYYVLSGTGQMVIDGTAFPVRAGDALLTRPGHSHALAQTGEEDLVIVITYPR
jgi:mannose-6-phosphate isomerase-like protein (cupin superfamily)